MAPYIWIIIFTIVYVLVRLRRRHFNTFRQLGLNGPEPSVWVGNLLQLNKKSSSPHLVIQEWTRQYGKTYGMYEGALPVVMTTDLDLIQEVFIKQFATFYSRKELPLAPDPDKVSGLFISRGPRWKRLRTIANPTFSAAKMKQMSPIMNECIEDFLAILDPKVQDGVPVDMYKLYQRLTLDVIGRCAFGLKSNCQHDEDSEYSKLCYKVFARDVSPAQYLFGEMMLLVPSLTPVLHRLMDVSMRMPGSVFAGLLRLMQPVIEYRRKHKEQMADRSDLVQLLLDAEIDEKEANEISLGDAEKLSSSMKVEKKLSSEEIVNMSIGFLLAGYDTTSNSLAYVTYLLATNPEVQEKLQEEIDSAFPDGQVPQYDNVTRMEYLDWVVHEGLRLFPLASPGLMRKAMQPSTINGIQFLKGMNLQVDVWSLHHDPDQWGDDHDKFVPERFSKERSEGRSPLAFLPFGAGPRTCIGMRFALMEEKIALIRILQKYTFQVCSETQIPLKVKAISTVQPCDGVVLKVVQRTPRS